MGLRGGYLCLMAIALDTTMITTIPGSRGRMVAL